MVSSSGLEWRSNQTKQSRQNNTKAAVQELCEYRNEHNTQLGAPKSPSGSRTDKFQTLGNKNPPNHFNSNPDSGNDTTHRVELRGKNEAGTKRGKFRLCCEVNGNYRGGPHMRSLISIDFPAPEMEPESAHVVSAVSVP